MRGAAWAVAVATVLALAVCERRTDTDFEFEDAPDVQTVRSRRPRRYIYDPQSPLCHELVCKKREVCLLRDAFTAQCASKKEVLRRGDTIVAARRERIDGDDDVFYEEEPGPDPDVEPPRASRRPDRPPERCVGCGAEAESGEGAQFVCGSDNRTYSSLCRLDLHNCVRRADVRLACRGFCPCRAPPAAPAPAAPAAPAARFHQRGSGVGANAVAPGTSRRGARGPAGCELDKMADRLLDWFSVLMEQAGGAREAGASARGFPRECKAEVRWMFAHLDTAGDGVLSRDDLYALRHDDRERCLRPFLAACARAGGGRSGGRGGARGGGRGGLTRAAWCGCLRRAARPCAALARAHPNPSPGAYVPACDARGFYRPRQCHAALGVCWCVDAHGVERPASRTKGQTACPEERDAAGEGGEGGEGGAGGLADDEDEEEAGSGDNELRF